MERTSVKDILGNPINVGDVFAYSVWSTSQATSVMNIYRLKEFTKRGDKEGALCTPVVVKDPFRVTMRDGFIKLSGFETGALRIAKAKEKAA